MANQTIAASANHDALTGRNAGEDITIQQGAVLTIDSMPQHTGRGILGDLLIQSGEIHIDGRYVREIAYSAGSGSLPAVGTALTYGAAGTAKVIRLNSGTSATGVLTITIQGALEEPAGTLTDGAWSATIDTSRVGLLMVFGEDQVWDATDATCTLRVTGDWYEIGVGTGADSQTITLPHSGIQHAIWVETGSGTGVFEIWHRVSTVASSVFWDSLSDWGNTYESGFVFAHPPGTGTLTFGTNSNGGAPPAGARIRIPNVHVGTTTVATPLVEVTPLTIASYLDMVDSGVTQNVFIDHLNASTAQITLNQTNGSTVSDSAIGLWTSTGAVNRNNAEVSLTNCAFVAGNGLAGDGPVLQFTIVDNVGGITVTDCVFFSGTNNNNNGSLNLTTMANIVFAGVNKLVSNQQDENTMAALRGSVSSNVQNTGTLLMLNGGVIATGGCVNWPLGDIAWGQLASRGSTENSLSILNLSGTDNFRVTSGRFLVGDQIQGFRGSQFTLTDASNLTVQNIGDIDAKLDNGGQGAHLLSLLGISNNVTMRRVWFDNLGASSRTLISTLNSASDALIENCSVQYSSELELDATRVTVKGVHAAAGNIGASNGVEDDLPNVIATIFYDHFKSDTVGAVGLLFNDRGARHIPDVVTTAGSPIWNGLGDLLMRTAGDQMEFTWPHFIKGHTGFRNVAANVAGVNPTTNHSFEYDLDTGGGFSGTWKTVSGANLSAETISPEGFRVKIRITCTTSNTGNQLRGFAIQTTTTIAAQKANLYPLDVYALDLTGLQPGSEVRVYQGTDPATAVALAGVESSGTTFNMVHSIPGQQGFLVVFAIGFQVIRIPLTFSAFDVSIPIQQALDRVFENA
jgi:hypothetical protein